MLIRFKRRRIDAAQPFRNYAELETQMAVLHTEERQEPRDADQWRSMRRIGPLVNYGVAIALRFIVVSALAATGMGTLLGAASSNVVEVPTLPCQPKMSPVFSDPDWREGAAFDTTHVRSTGDSYATTVFAFVNGDTLYVAMRATTSKSPPGGPRNDSKNAPEDQVVASFYSGQPDSITYTFITTRHGDMGHYSSADRYYSPKWTSFIYVADSSYVETMSIRLSDIGGDPSGIVHANFRRIAKYLGIDEAWSATAGTLRIRPYNAAASQSRAQQLAETNPLASVGKVQFYAGADARSMGGAVPFALSQKIRAVARIDVPLENGARGDSQIYITSRQTKPVLVGFGVAANARAFGPAFALVHQSREATAGITVSNTNELFVKPFFARHLAHDISLSLDSDTVANWQAMSSKRWTVPITFGVSQVQINGRQAIAMYGALGWNALPGLSASRWHAGVQLAFISRADGPECSAR